MISLGVHHFGKRTVWSLSYFLNYGYYDISPSLKFIKSPFSFTIKIILGMTFGILLYQCVLLSWEISLSKQIENNSLEMLQKSYVSKSEDGMVKIYWAVNGMKQDDPILIEFIRENVLVKPSYTSTKGLFIKPWFQIEIVMNLV